MREFIQPLPKVSIEKRKGKIKKVVLEQCNTFLHKNIIKMKRAYQTCDLMHGNICVSEPCICKGMHMSEMRKKRGGKRENSGRPKTKEGTKVIRVPISLVSKVEKLISNHKK